MATDKPRRGTVYWNDAHGNDTNFDQKDIEGRHHPYSVATTGWIIRDDERGVSIALSWNPEQSEVMFSKWDYREHHFFPRGVVLKVEYLDPERE